MATIEAALVTYLLAQTGLTALIDRRLYPDKAPQGEQLPYCVYLDVSNVFEHAHDGQLTLERPRKQISCYATTDVSSRAIGEQVKTALKDYRGTLSGLEVQYIKIINEFTSTETISEDNEVYVTDIEFEINYVN